MKIRTRAVAGAEIPTSSMADIAFLLIIFFMVTTTFAATRGIDFRLPKQEEPVTPEESAALEATLILVDASGRISVDGHPMNLENIQPYLIPKLQVNSKKFVIIQTDPEASYGDMVGVLDELKQARVENIVIPSREEIDTWSQMGF